ncbi:MAG: AbrB/MazE/SpoVT family DNA-binding domain-containing protein [Chloroflexota bacterium]
MDIRGFEFFGSATVGLRGQVVLPAKLRQKLRIAAGEKFIVLAHNLMPFPHIVFIKSEDMTSLFQKIFGRDYLLPARQSKKLRQVTREK